METLDHLSGVWHRFFPTTLYREGEKTIRILQQTLLLPTAGIEPRPPAQQVSEQSINPLPLGIQPFDETGESWLTFRTDFSCILF